MRPAIHREIRVAQDRPEGIAVALCVPGRVARELCGPPGVRSWIFDDDLRRLVRMPVEQLVRRFLVPGEAAGAAPAPAVWKTAVLAVTPMTPMKVVAAFGIAPNSPRLQRGANLSQLRSQYGPSAR